MFLFLMTPQLSTKVWSCSRKLRHAKKSHAVLADAFLVKAANIKMSGGFEALKMKELSDKFIRLR